MVNADTDSIMISKPDGAPWSEEEQDKFLEALNSIYPEKIRFEHDGIYTSVVVVKAKNYALLPEGETKIKTKGSSIRDQKKEPALREMMDAIISAMIYHRQETIIDIYHKYINEAIHVQDIKRWAQKKTITKPILECNGYTQHDIDSKKIRKNETVVWDAISNKEGIQEGDKVYLYPRIISEIKEVTQLKNGKIKEKITKETGLGLIEIWNNDHDTEKLVERVYSTICIFESVLNLDQFINYSLKKNQPLLANFKKEGNNE